MKARCKGQVRFVLVSATVPNINDVADWIGSGGGIENISSAKVFQVCFACDVKRAVEELTVLTVR
jgi:replicative superfamily II helicase